MARAAVMERRLAGTTSEDDRRNHSNYFTSDEETDDQVIDSPEKAVGSRKRLARQREGWRCKSQKCIATAVMLRLEEAARRQKIVDEAAGAIAEVVMDGIGEGVRGNVTAVPDWHWSKDLLGVDGDGNMRDDNMFFLANQIFDEEFPIERDAVDEVKKSSSSNDDSADDSEEDWSSMHHHDDSHGFPEYENGKWCHDIDLARFLDAPVWLLGHRRGGWTTALFDAEWEASDERCTSSNGHTRAQMVSELRDAEHRADVERRSELNRLRRARKRRRLQRHQNRRSSPTIDPLESRARATNPSFPRSRTDPSSSDESSSLSSLSSDDSDTEVTEPIRTSAVESGNDVRNEVANISSDSGGSNDAQNSEGSDSSEGVYVGNGDGAGVRVHRRVNRGNGRRRRRRMHPRHDLQGRPPTQSKWSDWAEMIEHEEPVGPAESEPNDLNGGNRPEVAQQQAHINSLRQVQPNLGQAVVEPSRSLPSSTSEEGVGKSETHREPSTNKDSEDDSDKDVT